MGIDVALKRGSAGQFDVVADGVTVASRGGGIVNQLLGTGWPDPDDVVDTLRETLTRRP